MSQAKIVDLDIYFPTKGIAWDVLKLNQDVVAIEAGIGKGQSQYLIGQVNGAIANEIPWFTWWIPDIADGSISSQTDFYLSLPGVKDHLTCIDIEPPDSGTRCINAAECLTAIRRIEDKTGKPPLLYSNLKYITEALGSPSWMVNYRWWLAQWYYKIYPLTFYTDYVSFLAKYGNQLPSSAAKLGISAQTIGWQFSAKGNGPALCSNNLGPKDVDLTVSTIQKEIFLSMLGVQTPPPPAFPALLKTNGMINIRNAPAFGNTDIGDLLADRIESTEYQAGFYHVHGWVHESVVSKVTN